MRNITVLKKKTHSIQREEINMTTQIQVWFHDVPELPNWLKVVAARGRII